MPYNFAEKYLGPWLEGDMRRESIIDTRLKMLDCMEEYGLELPNDEDNIRMNSTYFSLWLSAVNEADEGEMQFIEEDIFSVINMTLPNEYEFNSHPDDPACLGLWRISEYT